MFITVGQVLRAVVPMGIYASQSFQPISDSLRTPSVLPQARDSMEAEVRRNTFWLAYAMERQQGCGNGWVLSLDDQDVTQVLPVTGGQFNLGVRLHQL